MGGVKFALEGVGKSSKTAFNDVVRRSERDEIPFGKQTYKMVVRKPKDLTAWEVVALISDMADQTVIEVLQRHIDWAEKYVELFNNKWGPALCVKYDTSRFLFFGRALG